MGNSDNKDAAYPARGSVQFELTWAQAHRSYNVGQYARAIELFESIGDSGMASHVQFLQRGKTAAAA